MTGPVNALQTMKRNYKLIIKALIMTHEVVRIESNIYLKYATLADIYRQSCYSGGDISCKTMSPLIVMSMLVKILPMYFLQEPCVLQTDEVTQSHISYVDDVFCRIMVLLSRFF